MVGDCDFKRIEDFQYQFFELEIFIIISKMDDKFYLEWRREKGEKAPF